MPEHICMQTWLDVDIGGYGNGLGEEEEEESAVPCIHVKSRGDKIYTGVYFPPFLSLRHPGLFLSLSPYEVQRYRQKRGGQLKEEKNGLFLNAERDWTLSS